MDTGYQSYDSRELCIHPSQHSFGMSVGSTIPVSCVKLQCCWAMLTSLQPSVPLVSVTGLLASAVISTKSWLTGEIWWAPLGMGIGRKGSIHVPVFSPCNNINYTFVVFCIVTCIIIMQLCSIRTCISLYTCTCMCMYNPLFSLYTCWKCVCLLWLLFLYIYIRSVM